MKAKITRRDIFTKYMVVEFQAQDPAFTFQAGEYIQLVLPNGLKHYFSITSSPNECPIFRIATRPSETEYKKTLLELPIGTEVEINGPWGDLFLPEDKEDHFYCFIAGGIGITPFISMIKYKVEESLSCEINLVYFADPEPIFKMDLENLADRSPKVRVLFVHERVSPEVIKSKLLDNYMDATFMVAGAPEFVNSAVAALSALGIPQRQIIFESYTGY